MKILSIDEMDSLWDEYWNDMSQEWFKLEVLQDYSAEDDSLSLRAWLYGDKQTSIKLLKTDDDPDFTLDCKQKINKGVKLHRIHAVIEPYGPYLEWEIQYYKQISMPLRHEKVSIINYAQIRQLDLPSGDLMIFDSNRAIQNIYGKNGLMTHAKFYDNDDDIEQFLKLKIALQKIAKPLK